MPPLSSRPQLRGLPQVLNCFSSCFNFTPHRFQFAAASLNRGEGRRRCAGAKHGTQTQREVRLRAGFGKRKRKDVNGNHGEQRSRRGERLRCAVRSCGKSPEPRWRLRRWAIASRGRAQPKTGACGWVKPQRTRRRHDGVAARLRVRPSRFGASCAPIVIYGTTNPTRSLSAFPQDLQDQAHLSEEAKGQQAASAVDSHADR